MARVKSPSPLPRTESVEAAPKGEEVISLKHLEINKVTLIRLSAYGESHSLTPIEFDILYLLASNSGRVFGTDEISSASGMKILKEANNKYSYGIISAVCAEK